MFRIYNIGTNRPLFVHRRGSNVIHGEYYVDYKDDKPVRHYGAKSSIDIDQLRREYETVKNMSVEEATEGSPLLQGKHTGDVSPQKQYSYSFSGVGRNAPGEDEVKTVIAALDSKNRWLVKHMQTSNPYIGEGTKTDSTVTSATGNIYRHGLTSTICGFF